jgi:hypothetical protein
MVFGQSFVAIVRYLDLTRVNQSLSHDVPRRVDVGHGRGFKLVIDRLNQVQVTNILLNPHSHLCKIRYQKQSIVKIKNRRYSLAKNVV